MCFLKALQCLPFQQMDVRRLERRTSSMSTMQLVFWNASTVRLLIFFHLNVGRNVGHTFISATICYESHKWSYQGLSTLSTIVNRFTTFGEII
jgi:hypothetical protein